MKPRDWKAGLLIVLLVYLHNTLPYLTMMPRVNVDEPWLMERAYQVMETGIPSQPMLGLRHAYLLQVGYGYLLASWMALSGVGLFQARLLGVLLGLGIVGMVAVMGRRTIDSVTGLGAALFLALDSNFLGGVRNARTDIPSVFFGTAALLAYLLGRQQSRGAWFFCSGACLGLAVLCHGNAFWVGVVLLAWYLLDYGRRALVERFGYAFLGGARCKCR
jgi:4-amino-4-deoxy-L-arabinose transferase-like glycosyltransferase